MILPSPFAVLVLESERGSIRFHEALAALEHQPPPTWAGWLLTALRGTRTGIPDDDTATWARTFWFRIEGDQADIPREPCPGVRLYRSGDDAPITTDPRTVHDAQMIMGAVIGRFLESLDGDPIPEPEEIEAAEPEIEPEGVGPEPDPTPEPEEIVASEPEIEPEGEGPEPDPEADGPLSALEIDALTDPEVYAWIQTLERDYGVRPPRNSEILPIENLREWIRDQIHSDRVREGWRRRLQEAAERERQSDLAFPTIRDYVEVPIHGATVIRVTPHTGGYAVTARNDGVRPPEFYRSTHRSPPWRSDKIVTDTRAAIATAIARNGLGAESDAREWVAGAWDAISDLIRSDPDTDLATQSPAVKEALRNLVGVRIQRGEVTLTEVVYAVDGLSDRVSLEFDSKAYTGPVANLNERWYNQFAPEELNANKEDWGQIKRFWGSIAEVTTVEEYSTWDGVVERFQDHLRDVHYGRTITDLLTGGFGWFDEHGTELDPPRPGGVVWIPSAVIQTFVDKLNGEVRSANALAKVLKGRNLMVGGSKKLQRRSEGERLTRRAWPMSPGFVRFRPEWAQGRNEEEQV